jgi:hypothetical protein
VRSFGLFVVTQFRDHKGNVVVRGQKLRAVILLGLVSGGAAAHAATTIRIKYAAIQQLLTERVFNENGRKYVIGDKTSSCNYGYLEGPKVSGADGRITIQAHFSSRHGTEIGRTCIGPGLSSEVVVSGIPFVKDGVVGFRDIRIDQIGGDETSKVLKAYLEKNLQKTYEYRALDELQKVAQQSLIGSKVKPAIRSFDGTATVGTEALVIVLDVETSLD